MIHTNFGTLRRRRELSEEKLAERAGVSRLTVRQLQEQAGNPTVHSLSQVATALGAEVVLFLVSEILVFDSESSTAPVSMKVAEEPDSWPYHYMELVDAFRKTMDFRYLLLPPVARLGVRGKALLASIVCALCEETEQAPPSWALKKYFLPEPWFPSETESLKALALRDSPIWFRRNNIFVQDNFLVRA